MSTVGPHTSSGWSDLPTDLLTSILRLLELPAALAFAAVCASWRSAATADGVPRPRTPWLMSWAHLVEDWHSHPAKFSSSVTCKFRHLLDVDRAYDVTFPRGCFVTCCGASHGWLILVNELCNLLLYNPFTSDMIQLPPVAGFPYVEAVHDTQGNIQGYRLDKKRQLYDAKYLATFFYDKAVLSGSPSKGDNYIVTVIHGHGSCLSFARAGEDKWQVISTITSYGQGCYADCAYHNGRLYTVTYPGIVEKWDLDDGPSKEVLLGKQHHAPVVTRHLVPTPWGDLLQVSAVHDLRRMRYPDNIRFDFRKVESGGCKLEEAPRSYAMFLGLNRSTCLPVKDFLGLRPLIYFSAPSLMQTYGLLNGFRDWGGVKAYNVRKRTFRHVFPLPLRNFLIEPRPSEVWITPDMY